MLTATWSLVRLLATCLTTMALSSGAQAGYIYTYQGNTYTSVSGSKPEVTTSDSVTGFVEFTTLPTAGSFLGASDLIAYTLSDGAKTLSSTRGDDLFDLDGFFTFDSNLNIISWNFSMIPDGARTNAVAIYTTTDFDLTRVDAGNVSTGIARPGGVWTRQEVNGVPEPGTLSLVLLSLTTVMLWVRPRKQAGAAALTLPANAELPDVGTATCQLTTRASN